MMALQVGSKMSSANTSDHRSNQTQFENYTPDISVDSVMDLLNNAQFQMLIPSFALVLVTMFVGITGIIVDTFGIITRINSSNSQIFLELLEDMYIHF